MKEKLIISLKDYRLKSQGTFIKNSPHLEITWLIIERPVKWLTNNRVKTELTSECRVCWRLVGQRFGNVHKCKYGHLFMDPFCKGRLTLFPSRLFWLQSIGGPGIRASIWRRPAQPPRQDSENFRLRPRSRC